MYSQSHILTLTRLLLTYPYIPSGISPYAHSLSHPSNFHTHTLVHISVPCKHIYSHHMYSRAHIFTLKPLSLSLSLSVPHSFRYFLLCPLPHPHSVSHTLLTYSIAQSCSHLPADINDVSIIYTSLLHRPDSLTGT